MRSFQTIGLEAPYPGSFSFHFRFLVSLQLVGAFSSGADPSPLGPRHCGQFDDVWAALELNAMIREVSRKYFIIAMGCSSSVLRTQ